MTKYETLLTILAMFLLGSCSESLNSKVSTAADATPSFATSATPLPGATMVSPIPPSPTLTTATTPTVSLEARFQYHCLEIVSAFPPATTITGTLVLQGYQDHPTYLWNLETGAKIVLAENHFTGDLAGEINVSPDRKLLAYVFLEEQEKKLSIQIVNVEGQVLQSLPWDETWATIVGWLDNTHLMIDREGTPLYSLMILDPFTGQKQELFSHYPGIYPIWHEVDWEYFSAIAAVYDPTLTRVVYPNGPEYVLWDIPTRQVVARIPSYTALNNAPLWSPDGKQFLVVELPQEWKEDQPTQEELMVVSYEGKTTPLTHLSARFTGVYIRHAVWSPDGRYVAFWLGINVPPGNTYRDYMELAVLDTSTQTIKDYCLKESFSKGEWAPVWALNSTQLLVQAPPKTGKLSNNVLVDLAQGFAVQVEENAQNMAWMRSNP